MRLKNVYETEKRKIKKISENRVARKLRSYWKHHLLARLENTQIVEPTPPL